MFLIRNTFSFNGILAEELFNIRHMYSVRREKGFKHGASLIHAAIATVLQDFRAHCMKTIHVQPGKR